MLWAHDFSCSPWDKYKIDLGRQSKAKRGKERKWALQNKTEQKKKRKGNFTNPWKWKSSSLWLKIRIFLPRTKLQKPKPIMFLSTVLQGSYNLEVLFLRSPTWICFCDWRVSPITLQWLTIPLSPILSLLSRGFQIF